MFCFVCILHRQQVFLFFFPQTDLLNASGIGSDGFHVSKATKSSVVNVQARAASVGKDIWYQELVSVLKHSLKSKDTNMFYIYFNEAVQT